MKQMTTPLLSVIIPVYNAAGYLEQCISSVQGEGIEPMEIICVDDGSTDESVAVLERLALQDKRIQIIRQNNRSAGAARNNGLTHAKGEFVHFLDADDWLCAGIYRKSIACLQRHGADVCFFQYFSYDNSTGQIKKRPCLLNWDNKKTAFRSEPAFFIYNMVAPWNKIYRRKWLNDHALRFDEIVCGNDRGFYFRMLAAQGEFVLSRNYGVYYREQNSKSLTGSSRYKHFDSLFYAWDTSAAALAGQPNAVQAMLLDCVMKDLLRVFQQTPQKDRPHVLMELSRRLKQTDLSLVQALPIPCVWKEDAERIIAGEFPCQLRRRARDILGRLVSVLRIWGLRGYIAKLFA